MRNVNVVVVAVLVALMVIMPSTPALAQTARCNVGADPVNKDRQPTTDEQVIPNPADQKIVYESGNGRDVNCTLQAGVPVVVDKSTGVAKWVYGCGNGIKSFWVPKRLPPTGLPPMQGLKGDKGDPGMQGPPGENGQNSSSQNTEPWRPSFDANQQKQPVKHGHGLLIGGFAIAGALAAGLAFGMRGKNSSGNLNTCCSN